MDIKHLRRTCKLPHSFSTLIHSNIPPDLSQKMYLRGVSSNIAAHLVPIKADLNYFLDKVKDLQPDIQGVTLSCIERLRYIVLILSPLLLVNTKLYRSLCEGDSSHPQHLCPHCHYHILLQGKSTSGLDMTPSFSHIPSDESDDGGASCLEIRLSWASMHEKYDRFSKIIHELHAAYSILTQALAFHKKILSPIRYMPWDILEEIFIHAQDRDRFLVFSMLSTPWSLGHVCSLWRVIVSSFPLLWSHMLLFPQHHVLDPLNLMSTALIRSSNHALDFRYKYWPLYTCSSPHAHCVFTLLSKQAHRWERVRLSIPPSAYYLLVPIQGWLPHLKYLHLKGLSSPEPIQADSLMPVQIDAFESAQNLESAYMFGLPATLDVRLLWTQLVAFSDDCMLGGGRTQPLFFGRIEGRYKSKNDGHYPSLIPWRFSHVCKSHCKLFSERASHMWWQFPSQPLAS